jgi:hypothetical protein
MEMQSRRQPATRREMVVGTFYFSLVQTADNLPVFVF